MYKVKSLVGRYAHKVGLQRMKTLRVIGGRAFKLIEEIEGDDRGMGRHM